MAQTTKTCPKILSLLAKFYPPGSEVPPWEATVIDPITMPQPYRKLLVHQRDMTSTLTRHYGEEISLRVLDRVEGDDEVARHIVLECSGSGRAVEYGASRIRLSALDDAARRKVVEGRVPLGGILSTMHVVYGNCPRAYFEVLSNGVINRVFGLTESQRLFGRCNCLSDPTGNVLAEVVEILPP